MSRKRVFLTLALAGAVALVAPAAGAQVANDDGLLWRVKGENGAPSYIFGTVPPGDDEIPELPSEVASLFDEAERYAFGLDFGAQTRGKVADAMMASSGTRLNERLDDRTWLKLKEVAKQAELPIGGLNRFKTWAAARALAQAQIQLPDTLDWQLHERARERGAPITGLQTVDEKLAPFREMAQDEQIDMLKAVLERQAQGQLEGLYNAITSAWLEGNVPRLIELARAIPLLPDPESGTGLNQRLVDGRNTRMVTRMEPIIAEGGAFIAVGALQLPGDNGIIQKLKDAGYSVTAVR